MGIVKDYFKKQGYNLKEKSYIYTGLIVGGIAPLIAGRLLLGTAINPENWKEELIAWGASITLNSLSMIPRPHIPVPFYTGMGGLIFGVSAAKSSRAERLRKESRLENFTKERV